MPVNSTFGLGHLLIDPPQRAPGPVKRNRYIQLTGATKSVNRTLEANARALASSVRFTLLVAPVSWM
ncbi:hypothetical protein MAHJHV51_56480 [Mycobacterium avium subsp. hominissuis]